MVIDKPTYGAGEAIERHLREHDIQRVTVVGIDTDVCVLQNAAYLFDHGFAVGVDAAGTATNGGPEADKAAIPLLRRTLGREYVLLPAEAR